MPATALARHDPVPISAKPIKTPRIPPKIRQIVDWLVMGACKNQQAACERADLDPSYVSRELRKVHVQAYVARKTRETISNGTMRASARLLELLDASSEHVSLDASKHVLAIEGIRPPDNGTNINIINNIQPGYVVKLRHHDDAVIADIPQTRMIEHE